MVKNLMGLTLICMLFYSLLTNVPAQEKREHPVSVIWSPDGYSLSINSDNLPLGMLLEEISKRCQLRIITYEEALLTQLTTARFNDLSLDLGIKRLLKASGINNYFIQYRNDPKSKSNITVVTLLGKGPKAGEIATIKDLIKRENKKEGITPLTEPLFPEDEFAEKVAALKERYEWADEETEELAGYLLEIMPKPARTPGMEALIKKLDRIIAAEVNNKVDDKILFRALEDTAPPHLAPVMMKSIKQYSQQYKTGDPYETFEQSPDELFQEVTGIKSQQEIIP